MAAMLGAEPDQSAFERLRRAEVTGRPVGSAAFLEGLKARLGRAMKPKSPGRKSGAEIRQLSPDSNVRRYALLFLACSSA
jgi:hypothetical protein